MTRGRINIDPTRSNHAMVRKDIDMLLPILTKKLKIS
jgi:hypothetical protein